MNLRKIILCFAIFTTAITFAQSKVPDSLMQNLRNQDAYIVLTKTMSPRIKGNVGASIIKIGKRATPDLINILEDQHRGIIAHFLLSEIWKETWKEEVCCNVLSDGKIEIITINGLPIYIEANELHAKSDDLKANKQKWKKVTDV